MLSLYIHIPYCVQKCRYCSFFSTTYDRKHADLIIKAICNEIVQRQDEFAGGDLATVYIGGGTPTCLTVKQMQTLIRAVREQTSIPETSEFTVESNPNSLSMNMLSILKEGHVNRISIGVQSFSQQMLDWLGRSHSPAQAISAVKSARALGFKNISLDLIYGIPGLSNDMWRDTVRTALQLHPAHISAYSLSVDEGSTLCQETRTGTVKLQNDDDMANQYEDLVTMLEHAGYLQYEISNFSLPSYECKHNIHYWNRGAYIGVGPGAWSFSGNRRKRNMADIYVYLTTIRNNHAAFDFNEVLDLPQTATEELFLGLRMTGGMDMEGYALRHGRAVRDKILVQVTALRKDGLCIYHDGILRLTPKGMLLSDEVLSRLIT